MREIPKLLRTFLGFKFNYCIKTIRLIIHNTIPGDLLAEEILDDICIINIFFNHTPIQTFYLKYALILDDFKELLHWTIFLFQFKNGTFNRILVHYFENISNWYFIIYLEERWGDSLSLYLKFNIFRTIL